MALQPKVLQLMLVEIQALFVPISSWILHKIRVVLKTRITNLRALLKREKDLELAVDLEPSAV
jgi:hypothetical protein